MVDSDDLSASSIHYEETNHFLCSSYRFTSCGYILLNNEDDGYRIIWIESSESKEYNNYDFVQVENISSDQKGKLNIQAERNDIVEVCSGTFEEAIIDPNTGCTLSSLSNSDKKKITSSSYYATESFVNVVFEAYLHVDALLSDILHRRRNQLFHCDSNFHCMSLPDYFYNIVSFNSSNGRSITLVVTFANAASVAPTKNYHQGNKMKSKAASYAILVEIDVFDQSYEECEWLVHPSLSDSTFLREWSKTLAIRTRMAEKKIGPFSVSDVMSSKLKGCNLGVSCSDRDDEYYFENEDDENIELWEPFVSEKLENYKIAVKAPKTISMSSLYRFCDVITNDAVVKRHPVSQIKSKDFPLQIKYGQNLG